jgi:hypothetical protein
LFAPEWANPSPRSTPFAAVPSKIQAGFPLPNASNPPSASCATYRTATSATELKLRVPPGSPITRIPSVSTVGKVSVYVVFAPADASPGYAGDTDCAPTSTHEPSTLTCTRGRPVKYPPCAETAPEVNSTRLIRCLAGHSYPHHEVPFTSSSESVSLPVVTPSFSNARLPDCDDFEIATAPEAGAARLASDGNSVAGASEPGVSTSFRRLKL